LIRNIALYEASLCIQKPYHPTSEKFWQTPKFKSKLAKIVDSYKKVTPTIA
jgi:hypothetical protein